MSAVIPAAAACAFLRWLGQPPLAVAILGLAIGGSLAGVVLIGTKRDIDCVDCVPGIVAVIVATFGLASFAAMFSGSELGVLFLFAAVLSSFVFAARELTRRQRR